MNGKSIRKVPKKEHIPLSVQFATEATKNAKKMKMNPTLKLGTS